MDKHRKNVKAMLVGTLAYTGSRVGLPLWEVLIRFRNEWRTSLPEYAVQLGYDTLQEMVQDFSDAVHVQMDGAGRIRLFPEVNDMNKHLFDVINRTTYQDNRSPAVRRAQHLRSEQAARNIFVARLQPRNVTPPLMQTPPQVEESPRIGKWKVQKPMRRVGESFREVSDSTDATPQSARVQSSVPTTLSPSPVSLPAQFPQQRPIPSTPSFSQRSTFSRSQQPPMTSRARQCPIRNNFFSSFSRPRRGGLA